MQKFDAIDPRDTAPQAYGFSDFFANYTIIVDGQPRPDTIANAFVTPSSGSLTVSEVTHDENTVYFLTKGDVGSYALTVHIVTTGGAEWFRSVGLTVKAGI
jgi:hypothetical protein